jgi:hypothetical protein
LIGPKKPSWEERAGEARAQIFIGGVFVNSTPDSVVSRHLSLCVTQRLLLVCRVLPGLTVAAAMRANRL